MMQKMTKLTAHAALILLAGAGCAAYAQSDAHTEINASDVSFDVNSNLHVFEGDVSIRRGDFEMSASLVEIKEEDGEIVDLHARGTPVVFSDRIGDESQPINGQADTLRTDGDFNSVRLSGNARISSEGSALTAQEVTYDRDEGHVRAFGGSTGDSSRPRIVINDDN